MAIVFIILFTSVQIFAVQAANRLAADVSTTLCSLRTVMLGIILMLYLLVTSSLRNELKRLNSHGLKKELYLIKWLQRLTGLSLGFYCSISLASSIYFSNLFANKDPECATKVYYERVVSLPFVILYHSLPNMVIMVMHIKNNKSKPTSLN